MASVRVEPLAWGEARGWALWKALNHLVHDRAEPGRGRRADLRMGWRLHARDLIEEVIAHITGSDDPGELDRQPCANSREQRIRTDCCVHSSIRVQRRYRADQVSCAAGTPAFRTPASTA
jgi:hypothetical protein